MPVVQSVLVSKDESDMRLDRWFKLHYPNLTFVLLQKLLRSGQIRIDKKRAKSNYRLQEGQVLRIPPLSVETVKKESVFSYTPTEETKILNTMLLYEDESIFVFNKIFGLAVQGGSGITRHMDGLIQAWKNKKGERPRLVHRLDRETTGVLVVARTRLAAMKLAESFRTRKAKKTYWSLVRGVPRKPEGKISSWLLKEKTPEGDRMILAKHGDVGAEHAVSFYKTIEKAPHSFSWLEMEPYTGRTHQLRIHACSLGTPILGDTKYFIKDIDQDFMLPKGIQNRLHLHARRIVIPHPEKGILDISASMPAHMKQSWSILGFDEKNSEKMD